MSEEKQSNEATPSQTTAGTNGSAGKRLDQFISGAKRLTNVAANKARDYADAAAPRIKQIGDATTQHVSQAVNRQQFAGRGGPALEKALGLYRGANPKQKRIFFMAIGGFILIMIASIPVLIHATSGPGPTASNLSQVHTGMTPDEVHKLLGPSSTLTKGSDGSVTENWNSEYGNDQGMHVTFVDGKMTDKKLDDFGITDTKNATPAIVASATVADSSKNKHFGTWNLSIHKFEQADVFVGQGIRFSFHGAGCDNLQASWSGPDGHYNEWVPRSTLPAQSNSATITSVDDHTAVLKTNIGIDATLHLRFDGGTITGDARVEGTGDDYKITGTVE